MFNIVGTVGSAISDIGDVFYKNKTTSRGVVDVGVLRYPDIQRWIYSACDSIHADN